VIELKNEFIKIQQQSMQTFESENSFRSGSKVVRPIRGGGGKKLITPRSNTVASYNNVVQYD